MKRNKVILLVGLVLIFSSTSLLAMPLGGDFKFKAGFMLTDFQSTLQYDKNNVAGTQVNLGSDLDLENNSVVPFVEAWFGSRFVINLAYMDSRYESKTRTAANNITYNGVILVNAGQQASISVDFRTADIAAQFNFFNNKKFRVGAIAGLKYFYDKSRLVNETTSTVSSNDEETIFPYYGGEVEFTPIKYVSFSLRLRGTTYQWTDVDVKRVEYLDFELGVTFNLTNFVGVMVEYRFMQVKVTKLGSSSQEARFQSDVDSVVFSVVVRI